jgi:hypothetical protein
MDQAPEPRGNRDRAGSATVYRYDLAEDRWAKVEEATGATKHE